MYLFGTIFALLGDGKPFRRPPLTPFAPVCEFDPPWKTNFYPRKSLPSRGKNPASSATGRLSPGKTQVSQGNRPMPPGMRAVSPGKQVLSLGKNLPSPGKLRPYRGICSRPRGRPLLPRGRSILPPGNSGQNGEDGRTPGETTPAPREGDAAPGENGRFPCLNSFFLGEDPIFPSQSLEAVGKAPFRRVHASEFSDHLVFRFSKKMQPSFPRSGKSPATSPTPAKQPKK